MGDSSSKGFVPLRQPQGLAGHREGSQADLHRSHRSGRLERFADFAGVWEGRYPAIVKVWESAWAEFVPFLNFDPEIRTVIYTTNTIESLNARFRRAMKARGHFPTEQAALKCLYLTVMSLDPTGKGRTRWANRWKPALMPSQSLSKDV